METYIWIGLIAIIGCIVGCLSRMKGVTPMDIVFITIAEADGHMGFLWDFFDEWMEAKK